MSYFFDMYGRADRDFRLARAMNSGTNPSDIDFAAIYGPGNYALWDDCTFDDDRKATITQRDRIIACVLQRDGEWIPEHTVDDEADACIQHLGFLESERRRTVQRLGELKSEA